MEIKKESNDYIIKFNNHEVLVFFEWLVKFVENNEIIDEADQKNAVFGSVLTLLFSHHLSKPKGSRQSCPLGANQ